MLTGIEIAGTVLAILPLVISALEHYNETKRSILRFRNKTLVLKNLIQGLEEQKCLIQSDITVLLRSVGLGQLMSQNPVIHLEAILARSDVAEALERALGPLHDVYVNRLRRSADIILQVARSIEGIIGTTKYDLADLSYHAKRKVNSGGRYEFGVRIRVAAKSEKVYRLISALNESTKMLERLRIAGLAIDEEDDNFSGRKALRFATFLNKARNHAGRLHSAVSRSWNSSCQHVHSSRLALGSRSQAISESKFKLGFTLSIWTNLVESNVSFGYWHRCAVHLMDGNDAEYVNIPIPTLSNTRVDNETAGRRRVVFNLRADASTALPLLSSTPQTRIVENLCSDIQMACERCSVKQINLNTDGNLYCETPHQACSARPSEERENLEPLEDIMSSFSTFATDGARNQYWNLPNRMQFSFMLASSTMQLCSTPWLHSKLFKKNLLISRTLPGSAGSSGNTCPKVLSENVCVLRDFGQSQSLNTIEQRDAKGDLLELAITLLEIWHCKTIEQYASDNHFEVNDTYDARLRLASRWFSGTSADMLRKYRVAIALCIESQSSMVLPEPDWESAEFRKTFSQSVLIPLWENC